MTEWKAPTTDRPTNRKADPNERTNEKQTGTNERKADWNERTKSRLERTKSRLADWNK